MPDAGPPTSRDAAPLPPGRDAGDPPPPLSCPLVRATATCLESFLVEPNRAFALPIEFDGCGCCIETQCRVEVTTVGGTPTLMLETALCPDPCDCDACYTPRGACDVPPLTEGSWNVVVNGTQAFQLPVFADSGLVPPPPACASYAEPDFCAPSPAPRGTSGWRPDEVCVTRNRHETIELVAVNHCWSCGQLRGDCLARLEPRYTDDLPPGGEIHVTPTHHSTECDVDCPEVCMRAEQRCVLPPLVDGHFYRIWIDGEAMHSFTAGIGDLGCSASFVGGGSR